MVIDVRRGPPQYPPLTINGAAVERVSSTRFLGVHISEDLSWTTSSTQLARKAQTRLNFLRKLRRAHVPPPIRCSFYRGTIESVITGCITVWEKVQKPSGPLHQTVKQFYPPGCQDAELHPLPPPTPAPAPGP
ncbi:hypothetical protein D4764_18G0003240 [Takifugu flavidus]|uniref:Alkylated DNA repair protein AlkB homologue 8 N-terminal domain-containing protein n=1 Tax=Takifugu flavidus TaxID=433684 RepID=A0A5C6NRZ8_9TELE|nr:hypothetical protein D4764_18G0003240 [Takifugu flavidus]